MNCIWVKGQNAIQIAARSRALVSVINLLIQFCPSCNSGDGARFIMYQLTMSLTKSGDAIILLF